MCEIVSFHTQLNFKIKAKPVFVILLAFIFCSHPVFADVPPPPSNQIIGINDGVFSDLTEADCRLCHENPNQFPVEDRSISDRHHLLYETEIPDPTDAPYGTPGETFTCLSCHRIDISGGIITFVLERDCTVCHTQDSFFELTVHHKTDLALGTLPQGPDCKACHGSIVDNIQDGHTIPDYEPSLVTPRPHGGLGLSINSEGNSSGACNYCHSSGTGNPDMQGIDNATGVIVYSNEDTHHETGFWGGLPVHGGFVCDWCHDTYLPIEKKIRVCENCHGYDSLHNIQLDSDGDGIITPGSELPWYGHIGNSDDCLGCHGFSTSSDELPQSLGPIVPIIEIISKSVIIAGYNTETTLKGFAFRNTVRGIEYISIIQLTGIDGTVIDLIPNSMTENLLTVIIPETLAPGNYLLRAVKEDKQSNPVVISVKFSVVINSTFCDEEAGTITITGTGFGDSPPEGTDEYINVMLNGVPAQIISWSQTQIVISAPNCGEVIVNTIFGSSSEEPFCSACACDCDNDSTVDAFDLIVIKNEYNNEGCEVTPCYADFNADKKVNVFDLVIMKYEFGRSNCCVF